MNIPSISQTKRIIPNDLIRSSLFTISNHKMPRSYLKEHMLYTFGETTITYTGEELRQDDEDVWLQIIYLISKERSMHIEFMPYSLMAKLGWPRRTQYRDKLRMVLTRLSATSLAISNKSIKAGLAVSLVRKFEWTNNEGSALKRWRVWIEPEIRKLFANSLYTKIHWEQRMKLKPLAKWLHAYYSSHARPLPVPVAVLMKASGSKSKTFSHFKEQLKSSLSELAIIGFIKNDYFIDASNKLFVNRIGKHFGFLIHERF